MKGRSGMVVWHITGDSMKDTQFLRNVARRARMLPALAALVALAACDGGPDLDAARTVPYFYSPPSPLAPAEPGTVIRTEALVDPSGRVQVTGERIMYHSRTYDGRDIATTGMLFLPPGEPPAGGFPLVTFGHGTSGIVEECAPSLNPFRPAIGATSSNYDLFVQPWLDRNIAVVAADYQGEGAPGPYSFLVGRVEGQNVLDSARAARRLHGGKLNGQLLIFGHSQGGNSAGFAAQLLPEYAPELNLDGVILAAPAARLDIILQEAYKTEPATSPPVMPYGATVFLLLAGLSYEATYGVDVRDIIRPAYADELLPVFANSCFDVGGLPIGINSCVALVAELSAVIPNFPTIEDPLPSIAPSDVFYPLQDYPEVWQEKIRENSLGSEPIDAPILLVQGCKDHTVPPIQTFTYFKEDLCARGETVHLQQEPQQGHTPIVVGDQMKFILDWAQARLRGEPATSNCAEVESACAQEPDLDAACLFADRLIALIPQPPS